MANAATTDGTIQELLAANLRRMRIARHLSLSELARATAMSKATLSGIENGRANPTVETLAALAGALRVSVGELLAELPAGEIRISRAGEARFPPRQGVPSRLLDAAEEAGGVELWEVALPARSAHVLDPRPAGARATLVVREGTLIAGPVERSTELGPGDVIVFPADVPHALETTRRPARALVMVHVPR